MNPLTVAIMVITVFSAVAGVFIAQGLILPRLGSRKEAFVAAGSGLVAFVGLYYLMVLIGGYTALVVLIVPMTMILVCILGMLHEAIFGFRQHNCS